MTLRQPNIISRDVLAGIENTIVVPRAFVKYEIQIRDTEVGGVDAEGRLAFVENGTGDGGMYIPVNPDHWEKVQMPATTVFYIRSAVNNVFKLLWWEGM